MEKLFYFLKHSYPLFILFSIFVVFLITDILWIHLNQAPPHWDMGRHLYNAVSVFNDLKRPDYYYNSAKPNYLENYLYTWTVPYMFYPPFVYTVTGTIFILTRHISTQIALYSLIPFALIAICFTYLLSREFLSKKASLIAVIYLMAAPIVFTQFHEYMLDVPLLAMYVLSLYLLLKTKYFTSPVYSILFGISLGLGMMTKWTFALLIIGPTLFVALFTAKNTLAQIKIKDYTYVRTICIHIFIIIVLLSAIAGSWYINNLSPLKVDLLYNAASGKANYLKPGIDWALFYITNEENAQLYAVYFLLFIAGLIWVQTRSKELRNKFLFITFSLAVSYIILTFLNNKDPRYFIPLLIFPAIFTAALFDYLPFIQKKLYTAITITCFVIFSLFQIYFVSFASSATPLTFAFTLPPFHPFMLIQNNGYTSGPPVKGNWQIDTVINDLEQNEKASTLSNNNSLYLYMADTFQKQYAAYPKSYYNNYVYFIGDNSFKFNTWTIQYLLAKTKSDLSFNDTYNPQTSSGYLIAHYDAENISSFTLSPLPVGSALLHTYQLPDGSKAFLIKLPEHDSLPTNTCETIGIKIYQCKVR